MPSTELSEKEGRREGSGEQEVVVAGTVAVGAIKLGAVGHQHQHQSTAEGCHTEWGKSGLSFASLLPPSRPFKNVSKHLLLATPEVRTVVEFTTQSTQGPQNNLLLARSTLTLLHA